METKYIILNGQGSCFKISSSCRRHLESLSGEIEGASRMPTVEARTDPNLIDAVLWCKERNIRYAGEFNTLVLVKVRADLCHPRYCKIVQHRENMKGQEKLEFDLAQYRLDQILAHLETQCSKEEIHRLATEDIIPVLGRE